MDRQPGEQARGGRRGTGPRVSSGLAPFVCLLCVGLAFEGLVLALLNGRALEEVLVEESILTVAVLAAAFSGVGALIASHRPGNAIGWLRGLTGGGSQLAIVVSTPGIAAQEFGVRLRDETDLDDVGGDLVAAVRDTVRPSSAVSSQRADRETRTGGCDSRWGGPCRSCCSPRPTPPTRWWPGRDRCRVPRRWGTRWRGSGGLRG